MLRILRGRAGPIAAVLAYLAVGGAYLEAVPAWEAPDEPWHLVYAEAVAAGRLPSPGETYEAHQPPAYYLWPAYALRAAGLGALPRSADDPHYPLVPTAFLHPPGEAARGGLRLVRAFSSLLGAFTVVLAWATARAATGRRGLVPLLAASGVALLPQLAFVGHAVSNDVLAAGVGAWLTYALVRLVRGGADRRPPAAALLALGAALAVFTKLNVLVALPPALAGAALVVRHDPAARRRVVAAGVGAVAAAAASAVLLAVTAPVTAAALLADLRARGGGAEEAFAVGVRDFPRQLGHLLASTWGWFGWFSVPYPTAVLVAVGAAAAVGLVGLGRAWRAAPDAQRRAMAIAGIVVASTAVGAGANMLADRQSQGRLLFPALAALALLAATGWLGVAPPARRGWAAATLVVALVGANALATGWLLPRAYADRPGAPVVGARIVPVPWSVAARLEGPHDAVRQTFRVTRPGLRRVEIGLAGVEGGGTLELRLRQAGDDGPPLAERRVALADGLDPGWLGLDVGPLADSAGRAFALEVRLVGGGSVRLWGGRGDPYADGELVVDGRAAGDLMLLALVEGPATGNQAGREGARAP